MYTSLVLLPLMVWLMLEPIHREESENLPCSVQCTACFPGSPGKDFLSLHHGSSLALVRASPQSYLQSHDNPGLCFCAEVQFLFTVTCHSAHGQPHQEEGDAG
jgi:hypothetical protein